MDLSALQEMRSAGELCDLAIQVCDSQLHVHRVLIASRSHYFRGLLRSGMEDSNHVVLDEMPGGYSTLELIVDFCYGVPVIERLNESNIAHVLCSARYLQMSGPRNLEDICRSKLESLTSRSLLSCLDILNNCADIGFTAEREGVTRRCIETAAKKFSWSTTRIDKKFLESVKDLPISWLVEILEAMQERKCSESLIASLCTFYIGAMLESFASASSEEQNSFDGSSVYLLCRPSMADKKRLLQAFDAVLAYVPLKAPKLRNAGVQCNPTWFAKALEFATTNSLTSSKRLYVMCAIIYERLAGEDYDVDNAYYNFKPNVMIELNTVAVQVLNSESGATVAQLTDTYLFGQARRRSISPSQFTEVLQSTACCSRPSYDRLYNALEEMLKIPDDVMHMSDTEVTRLISEVDFMKLSQDSLERAAGNDRIPDDITKMAAVKLCSQLRSDVHRLEEEVEDLRSSKDQLETRIKKKKQQLLWRDS